MRRHVLAVGRVTIGVPLMLAVVASATGWLYTIGPSASLPGPRIGDGLPLDELSKRASVPLLAFLGVWALAALLLGLLARFVRVERLSAALLLALGVGAWGYLSTGVSILVIRQIPAEAAFHAASRLHAVYLAAALAGLAGALLGRRARGRSNERWPFVLAAFIFVAGLLDVIDAILPIHRTSLLERLAPDAVHPVANALAAPVGVVLMLLARSLARRKRRAWRIAVPLLLGSCALHIFHGMGMGAVATGLLAIALVARRQDFSGAGDPTSQPRVFLRAALLVAAIYAYGAAALWVNRLVADRPFTLPFSLSETSRALVGLSLVQGHRHLSGDFAGWFPASVVILELVAVVAVLAAWLAPWRYRLHQEAGERELVRALVSTYGEDTLAPFALRADKSYFFSDSERAFLAYRVVGGVAIMSGDPIGPEDELEPLFARFVEFVHARDWRIAILGASDRCLPLYRAHGLQAIYHGDEAVVETAGFSLDGRAIRKVRQSVHRLEKAGYSVRVATPGELSDELRDELEAVARAWRGSAPERGFAMALDALFRLDGDDAVFVIGRGPDGAAEGFLHFAVTPAGRALSLSTMPRLRSVPNGFTEWLVCASVEWARDNGYEKVSLNFSPFAALLGPEAQLSAAQRLQRRALLGLKGHFQLDNLLVFNRKFFPYYQPRFVVYERRRDLPRVGIAALAAESYLPFQKPRKATV
jgi:lysyl-tRNA synthetase, class II